MGDRFRSPIQIADMKTTLVALVVSLLLSQQAIGQDSLRPMRLSPVVIEDIGTSNPSSDSELQRSPVQQPEKAGNRLQASPTTTGVGANLAQLRKPISQIRIDGLTPPSLVSQPSFTDATDRMITATAIGASDPLQQRTVYHHRPLYFEDATLERCGYSDCVTSVGALTNVHSAAKFLFDTAVLPYRMIQSPADQLLPSVAR